MLSSRGRDGGTGERDALCDANSLKRRARGEELCTAAFDGESVCFCSGPAGAAAASSGDTLRLSARCGLLLALKPTPKFRGDCATACSGTS
jgi:hypothetical protein